MLLNMVVLHQVSEYGGSEHGGSSFLQRSVPLGPQAGRLADTRGTAELWPGQDPTTVLDHVHHCTDQALRETLMILLLSFCLLISFVY